MILICNQYLIREKHNDWISQYTQKRVIFLLKMLFCQGDWTSCGTKKASDDYTDSL